MPVFSTLRHRLSKQILRARFRNRKKTTTSSAESGNFVLEALEPRLLLSADPLGITGTVNLAAAAPDAVAPTAVLTAPAAGLVSTSTDNTVTSNVSSVGQFQNEIFASGFDLPTTTTFLPGGKMLVGQLGGTVRLLLPPYTQIRTYAVPADHQYWLAISATRDFTLLLSIPIS